MAWQQFSYNNIDCYTGDTPWDEFGLALSRIAVEYEDTYGRKPRIIELLYALRIVVSSQNVFDLEENESILLEYQIVNLHEQSSDKLLQSQKKKINLEAIYKFEGFYTDITEPGYYLISRVSNLEIGSKQEDCIKILTLEVKDNILFCDFEILKDDIDDLDACKFIFKYLLQEYCDNYYNEKASTIQFKNIVLDTTYSVPLDR